MSGEPIADELRVEFDTLAAWTEQVISALGPAYAIPAACRGSGSPAALAWLAEAMEVRRARRFLDVGAGLGGPAAWLAKRYKANVILAEPMPAAAEGARRLFDRPGVVAWSDRLPCRTSSFDAAWALGVLCTTTAKEALLRELRRVLIPSGHLGLLVFVATRPLEHQPTGNTFSPEGSLEPLLERAGFWVAESIGVDSLPDPPLAWRTRAARVDSELSSTFGADPRFGVVERQGTEMDRLLQSGDVVPQLIHAVAV